MYQRFFIARSKDFYRFFRSPKCTITIIAVLTVLFFSGLVIPQKRFYQSRAQYEEWKSNYPYFSAVVEFFRLNEIYVAPVTIVFFAVFFANLLAVTLSRFPVVLRRAYLTDGGRSGASMSRIRELPEVRVLSVDNCRVTTEVHKDTVKAIEVFFRKRMWSIIPTGDANSLLALRNRYSPFGFLFFHFSFILCLIGGLLVSYTRFSGNLLLTTGQDFHDDRTQFRNIKEPRLFKALPPIGIRVINVEPRYEKGMAADLKVRMKFRYFEDEEEVVVRVNEPVKKGPVAVFAQDIGVSPLFTLKTAGGQEITGGFFSLNVFKGREDAFEFEQLPFTFRVLFYPDYAVDGGVEYSKSLDLNNPAIHLKVVKEGRTVQEGTLFPKQSVSFDGYQVGWEDTRYWVDFLVVREYGNIPLFTGFIMGGIGLIMRLVFYQKELKIYVEESADACRVFVAGRSEYYRHSFQEELDGLAASLQTMLSKRLTDRPAAG